MAKAFVRQLPRVPSDALPDDANCPICAQPYENLTRDSGSEKAVALPCSDKHIFGSDCLTEWLTYGKNCPLCRRGMALPRDVARLTTDIQTRVLRRTIEGDQEMDDYWYRIFWILHLHGDRAVERAWHEWRQDYIWAAGQCDRSCQAQARAALSVSPLLIAKIPGFKITTCAAAIQTLRFREYRLFLSFQADASEHPELKAPPVFQLTPAQENELFNELDRRQAFDPAFTRPPAITKREKWSWIRDLGFVWDPDWDTLWSDKPGCWRQRAY